MNQHLKAQFAALEKDRQELFATLKKQSDETLNKQPAPGKWSVNQVILHLMASEGASLRYLQKKTQDTSKAQNAGLRGKWRLFLVKTAFSLPINFKAPESMEPSDKFELLADLDAQWAKIRHDTVALLDKLPEGDMDKEIWKHVVSGKMNIYQMIDFFNFHYQRHKGQIERTLKAVA